MTATDAARTFRDAARYLLDSGWIRDGQDTGLWLDPVQSPSRTWMDVGEALIVQWERDGVSMLSAVEATSSEAPVPGASGTAEGCRYALAEAALLLEVLAGQIAALARESWNTPSRPRFDENLFGERSRPPGPKRRWVRHLRTPMTGYRSSPDSDSGLGTPQPQEDV